MRKYLPAILGTVSRIFPKAAAKIAFHFFATPIRIPRPESERLWHEQSKKYFLKSGIAAFEWGEEKNPLVLLIHGWNGRGTQIASFAPMLVERGFRVVALDGPGHGVSSGKKTNPSHYAKFIEDSQNELSPGGVHAVIAHSFGGSCSVLAASRGFKTKKMVLVASPAFYNKVVHNFAASMNLSEKSEKNFTEIVTKITGIPPEKLNIAEIGKTLGLPSMIVHDVNDNAVNFISAEALHEAWPHSVLLKTEGLGHRRILKDKDVILAVAGFISA